MPLYISRADKLADLDRKIRINLNYHLFHTVKDRELCQKVKLWKINNPDN